MRIWVIVLKVFAYVWLTAAAFFILTGISSTWMKGGFFSVKELMSPFHILNYIAIVVTLASGIGALASADRQNFMLPPSK